tara:strand:+ start:909 stop:1100 length:192 start_codon:yes stop_codon:yes gene_type:complete
MNTDKSIFYNEVLNFISHILISIILCYVLIPKAQFIILIFVSLGFGALREYIQKKMVIYSLNL